MTADDVSREGRDESGCTGNCWSHAPADEVCDWCREHRFHMGPEGRSRAGFEKRVVPPGPQPEPHCPTRICSFCFPGEPCRGEDCGVCSRAIANASQVVLPDDEGYDDAFDVCPEPTCPLYGKAVMADHRHLPGNARCWRKTGFITEERYCGLHGRAAGWPCTSENASGQTAPAAEGHCDDR